MTIPTTAEPALVTDKVEISSRVHLKWQPGEGPRAPDARRTRTSLPTEVRIVEVIIVFSWSERTREWIVPMATFVREVLRKIDGSFGEPRSRQLYATAKPEWLQEIVDAYLPKDAPTVTWEAS